MVAPAGAAAGAPAARLAYIDAARGIGIGCVVTGHIVSGSGSLAERAIWVFHIPLFFFLAGLTLSAPRAQQGPLATLRGSLYTLGIPYAFFGLVSWLLWLAQRGPAATSGHALGPLLRMLYGVSGSQVWFPHNQTLWFFTCLVSIQLLFACLFLFRRSPAISAMLAAALALSAAALAPYAGFRLPWNLDVACVGVAFYAIGHATRRHLAGWQPRWLPGLVIAGGGLALVTAVAQLNGRIDLNAFVMGNPLLFAVGAAAGIAMSLVLGKALSGVRLLCLIGEASIVIFPLHVLPAWLGLDRVFSIVRWYGERALHSPLAGALVLASLQILLCLPVYFALRRWAPILIGKRRTTVQAAST